MNKIPIYQHPFVDVFKSIKLTEWQLGHKEGDVTEVYDKELAKNVIKINGVTTASNYIQVPAQKHLPKKALGLTGKYVYITLNVPAGKSFVIHFDYTVNETRLVRLSISNIYKEFKNLNGNSLQVPINLPYAKWTMIALNAYNLLESNNVFISGQAHSFSMRSFQATANSSIKGIFTSDIKYTVQTLPKDMAMKNTKDKEWFAQYAWIDYPHDQQNEIDQMTLQEEKSSGVETGKENNKNKSNKVLSKQADLKSKKQIADKNLNDNEESKTGPRPNRQNISNEQQSSQVSQQRPKSIIRKQSTTSNNSGQKTQAHKSVKFNSDTFGESRELNKDLQQFNNFKSQNLPLSNLKDEDDLQRDIDQGFEDYKQLNQATLNSKPLSNDEIIYGAGTIERTLKEIQEMQINHNYSLEQKNITNDAQITLYQQQNDKLPQGVISRTQGFNYENDKEKFVLKPNPIMRVDRVIGMHPRFQSGQIYYNKDLKLSRELLYTQANLLLGYYPPQQRQRLFYDHQTSVIEYLFVYQNYAFTCCKSSSKDEGQKDYEVSIWDVQDQLCLFTFKPPLQSILSLSVSCDSSLLAISGKDFQKRDLFLVYLLADMIKYKKVEIHARQLSDFDVVNLRFNDVSSSSLVSCGKENIRFYKLKNSHLPGQSVALNNTGRGKTFNHSVVDFTLNDKNQKKPGYVYVTTTCGLLYFANYSSRQIDKIIQIHEDKITSLKLSPEQKFCVTTSINGILRIWSTDFSKLISEVNTQQPIVDCDINLTEKEISVLSSQGTVAVLDLELSSYNVLIRSHQENITDLCYNSQTKKLVTVGLDSYIKIWNAETMDLENEFTTQNDLPTKISSSHQDCCVSVGFKSGFLRIFDLQQGKLLAETMIYESPIMDIQYSPDNRFLGIFYKSSKIVIFNVEKGYQPIKTIDYEFPNDNYFSLDFSADGKYMANISSNANNITVWETKNFSLKFHLDLTGDIIQKIRFAPNSKDFVVLTTSSKLKFYRIGFNELQFMKESYGVTDMECLDFEISANNKYIFVAGREGLIKVYDYFMRGEVIASCQAFLGHFKYPIKVIAQDDLRFVYSIGEGNGVFKWCFYGDKEVPLELNKYFEELKPKTSTNLNNQQLQQQDPVFERDELMRMTENHQNYYQTQLEQINLQDQQQYQEGNLDMIPTRDFDPAHSTQNPFMNQKSLAQSNQLQKTAQNPYGLTHDSLIQYNKSGYRYEQYEMELKKVLSCTTDQSVKNNLVWNKELRYIAYTSSNYVIVEDINQEKTQRLLKEGNDKIYSLKLSPSGRLLLAFSKYGNIDGFPCIFIWDAATLKKLNQIAINDSEIISVEFSVHSNMLLVISRSQNNNSFDNEKISQKQSDIVSTISVWDFLEGHKDILCKSQLPMNVLDGRWNYYLPESNEFVTISERKYHYWKISNTLSLQYQEGDIPKKKDPFSSKEDQFTSLEFVVPTPEQISAYLLIGLNTGYVWVLDSRANQFLYSVKAIDSSIKNFITTYTRIIIEGLNDTEVHCWPQGMGDFGKGDPQSFFLDKEIKLTLDGFPRGVCYEESGNECMISSSAGTIWLMSWTEMATVKLKSCHNPKYQINSMDYKYIPPSQFQIYQEQEEFYQFDQNYMIASGGKDGIIKLWNMFDCEFHLQFIVPKEECVAIAMHQFKPYMVTSFTDGFIRFFEVNKSQNLGRCQIYSDQEKSVTDYLVSMRILPSGNHILGASKHGQIVLIFVQQWDPLAIKIEQIASINTSINSFDVSILEPYNKWLVGTANGKIIVYNRKDFNSFQQEIFDEENPPKFNFMDSFNLLDYVDNNFTESKRCNTLDHYYSISKRNMVYNEVEDQNLCEGIFSNIDLTIYLGFIKKCNYIFMRNFELHQVIKRIELQSMPLQIGITPNSPFFIVLQQDNNIKMIDLVNEQNTSEIKTIHDEVKIMKVCPNGRYIITGGNQGDICIWSIKKKQVQVNEE
eukprot:403333335